MAKKNIGRSFNIYPMPVVIVGTVTDGEPNFMTAAWITKLHSDPPLVGVSLGRKQHTAKGIQQTGQFSISLPQRRSGCARRLPADSYTATKRTRPRRSTSSRERWSPRPWCANVPSPSSAVSARP